MPSKNVVKAYAPYSYYHIYNRGVEKRPIFLDKQDYTVFLNLLKRYLSKEGIRDNYGRDGVTFYDEIELLSYCLMPNHFHMLVYINDNPMAISSLLQRVNTAYVIYFNKKYERVGPLFQSVYKASHIITDDYLQHITRYIHLNPKDYKNWSYSSWPYYEKGWKAEWVRPERVLSLFEGESYAEFVADYAGFKEGLEELSLIAADR